MIQKKLIVGNWKMNLTTHQASVLVHRLQERIDNHTDVEVVLAPTALTLQPLSRQIDRRKFKLAAQHAQSLDAGAMTGEISVAMVRELVHYLFVGHSDRRHKFMESDEEISHQVAAAIRYEVSPIICVGETAAQKHDGHTKRVINSQVTSALKMLSAGDMKNVNFAYEPVWAISGGKDFKDHAMPTPEDAHKAAEVIHENIAAHFGPRAANKVRILYGGSANADNSAAYLAVANISGLLIGGASLNYDQFARIVNNAHNKAQE